MDEQSLTRELVIPRRAEGAGSRNRDRSHLSVRH